MQGKYGVNQDHYCYEDSDVLINLLNIRDPDELTQAEAEFTLMRYSEYCSDLDELEDFDSNHFLSLHRLLFQDIYEWAGTIRDVDISKANTRFCTCSRVEPELKNAISRIPLIRFCHNKHELVVLIADIFSDLNVVHPFREGNGRTTRFFFEELLHVAGYRIEWPLITKEEWVDANIHGYFGQMHKLEVIFDAAIIEP
ncbi:Fic/DOC family protein [Shewanella cutis]|uniref:protein adenylyltransferase n=1 Tax=Shewanella cutis TaxID=2766780 RepID=A0ABS9QZS0_9GAMM|nr:Fic family protein [Shewanella sp. PS-2]MCG9965832.1 Fic family protein [Shewanella sp. PS-2]